MPVCKAFSYIQSISFTVYHIFTNVIKEIVSCTPLANQIPRLFLQLIVAEGFLQNIIAQPFHHDR